MVEVKGSLFVHFPKTGGTFVREIIKPFGKRVVTDGYHRSHATLDAVNLDDYNFSFACVRNPLSWYESVWKFLVDFHGNGGTWKNEEWNPMTDLSNVFSKDFNKFIKGCLSEYPNHYTKCLKLYLGNDLNSLDMVLKTETLSFDLCNALDKIGIPYNVVRMVSEMHHGKREKGLSWSSNKSQIIKNEMEVIEKFYL